MKKNMKKILIFIFIMLISISGIYIISQKIKEENNQVEDLTKVGENNQVENLTNIGEKNQQEEFVNIAECSEEFMEEYFEKSKELKEKNNKDNILIVTSKEKIENTFGASDIIEAPNNQYILQYDSEEEKNIALDEFKKLDDTVKVEKNTTYTIADYNSWGIEKTGLDYATKIANEKNLNEVTVAIIDTGCDMQLFNKNYYGKIVETYNVLNPGGNMVDEDSHGTHIAGTIAEATPDNVKILPVKVATNGKVMYITDIIEAINYIVYYDKADVINMSFGGYYFSDAIYQAIEAANKENIISIAAAGNDNKSSEFYPAAFNNTISIASVDSNLNKSDFSNYGSTITFSAPGTNILSINGTKSGTSMATPHAVSAVAILKSYNKKISLDNTIELLKRYAIDLGENGYDNYYGYGLINFKGVEFYDGNAGDEYNIFKNDYSSIKDIVKIEIPEIFSAIYNYGNNTNLMNAKINVYYTDNDYYTKQLWELENVEITEYEPYSYTVQKVKIKYKGKENVLTVNNQEATISGWEYTINEDNNISITNFNNNIVLKNEYPAKVYIPQELDGRKVTRISDSAFKGCSRLRKVVLPDNITEIGNEAFRGCEKLNKVEMPNGLKQIKDYAFLDCISLQSIEFPDGIEEIGKGTFEGCEKLKKILIPKSLTNIVSDSFHRCYGLEEIIVDEENSKYDSRDNCNALIETDKNRLIIGTFNTEIPSTVKTIGAEAFFQNEKLTKIIIPEGIEEIEAQAFAYCNNLENVIIPKSVNNISFTQGDLGENPFHGCENITIWIHKDSYAEKCAKEQKLNYRSIEVNVSIDKKEYKAFESVDTDNAEMIIDYDDTEREVITGGINIKYTDKNTSFRYGDTYFTASDYNLMGLFIEKRVEVTVTKNIPEYTLPSNITATVGQQLSEIELPDGFEWMDENQIIEDSENTRYKAKYIPKDTTNYEIVENIEIPISLNTYAKYQYVEETNEVIVKIISNVELKDTKPTWKLSEDKKVYTKVFSKNIEYTTSVQDINGKITNIEINIDQIKILQVETKNIYNEEKNEVMVQIISNIELKDTKPTWNLSEDRKIYTKIFTKNIEYATPIEDKWGNCIDADIKVIDVKKLEIKTKYEHDEQTNEVIAKIISNINLKDTKPTWKLSEDRKTYTKLYTENSTYTTRVESINGEYIDVELNIVDVDVKGPEINIDYKYNNDNTVTIYMKSNEKLGDTKPTWKLSDDKMTYEKNYSTDKEDYTTKVQDIYGNTTEVKIVLKKKYEDLILGDATVKVAYIYTTYNNVIVQIISNKELKATKPTWNLSEDQKTYTKIFNRNENYTTPIQFVDEEKYDIKISIDYF